MPLTPIPQLMKDARRDGYALGYFESWNIESLQGVLDAAEETTSPVIIGFNGEFLSSDRRLAGERLEMVGALGRAAAESAGVPCGFIFNECSRDEWTIQAVEAGFNLVMPADAGASLDDYTRRVQAITRHAHAEGIAVEAELGELPHGSAEPGHGSLTDPEEAAAFVAATGVDLLAVSVGNIHVLLEGDEGLDLEHLEKINKAVAIPLVLHGGTGIKAGDLEEAINLGVAKVNYGTYLKQRYLAAVRTALTSNEPDPHKLLGLGGDKDIMMAGRFAVKSAVLERIGLLGCCGRG